MTVSQEKASFSTTIKQNWLMYSRPALAVAALFVGTVCAQAQTIRRGAPTGTSRVGAHYIWQGEDRGQSVDANLDLIPNFLLRGYHTRIEFDNATKGASSAVGLAITEAHPTGRYTLTYFKGWLDDGLVRHDRDSVELAWSRDISDSWEIEFSVTRYDNPTELAPSLVAPELTARFNSGTGFSLDFSWSTKDTLGGTDREEPTWSAGISYRF